jgi:hypothetical protein
LQPYRIEGKAAIKDFFVTLFAPDEIVQMFEPQEINIAVTGGEAQGAWKMFGARYERTVSIDAWR